MPSELKPCPFDGAEGEVIGAGFGEPEWKQISCVKCCCSTGAWATEAEAIAAWNTRTPDPQLSALQWTPIDAEHLPKVGDEVLMRFQSALYVREVLSVCGLGKGWTHFRPINAPAPSGVQGKERGL